MNKCPNILIDAQVNFVEKGDVNEQLEGIGELIYNKNPEEASKLHMNKANAW